MRSNHRPLEFIFNPRKELPKVTISRILRKAIRLMAFDFDIEHVKENSIPHVDALSRLLFYKESEEQFEDTFLHWVETYVLSLDRMAVETRHDPVLSRITSRIRKNIWGNCSRAERPYKEIRHKLMIEHGVICNGDLFDNSPETQRKLVTKSVHGDIAATQKSIKLEAWLRGYSQDIEEYIKSCKKCKELRNFTDYSTFMAQRSGAVESCVYGSCIHYLSGTFINTSRLFFRLAWSNPCARQGKFYNKTDSKGHIFSETVYQKPWYPTMHQKFVMEILIYGWKK